MLALTRRVGEIIDIKLPNGEMIELKVVEIRGKVAVRLGLLAPANCAITRREITDRLQEPAT